jgi:hypothetical protein
LEQPFVGPEPRIFPAATTRYLNFNWELGIVSGPNNEVYYDPLIRSAASPATAEPLRERPLQKEAVVERPQSNSEIAPQTAIRSNKDWYKWAAENIQPSDDLRNYGAKKAYATKLAAQMKADSKINMNIRPRQAQTIVARFNERDLWPKRTDKKTTK